VAVDSCPHTAEGESAYRRSRCSLHSGAGLDGQIGDSGLRTAERQLAERLLLKGSHSRDGSPNMFFTCAPLSVRSAPLTASVPPPVTGPVTVVGVTLAMRRVAPTSTPRVPAT